jgi:hypothetical protein
MSLASRSPGSSARGARAGGAVGCAVGAAVSGCRPGPDITVAGSYFPSWMLALVIGILATVACWQLFTYIGIDPYLRPRPLVYAGLILIVTLVLWLGVFRG